MNLCFHNFHWKISEIVFTLVRFISKGLYFTAFCYIKANRICVSSESFVMDEFWDHGLFFSLEDTDNGCTSLLESDTEGPANCLMGTFRESSNCVLVDKDMFERPNKCCLCHIWCLLQ